VRLTYVRAGFLLTGRVVDLTTGLVVDLTVVRDLVRASYLSLETEVGWDPLLRG